MFYVRCLLLRSTFAATAPRSAVAELGVVRRLCTRPVKVVLKASQVILGYVEASEARTDPAMGCGEATFHPTDSYSAVEDLFRRKTLSSGILGPRDETKLEAVAVALSAFQLALETEDGQSLAVVGFTVSDYRLELPDEPLTFEFWGMQHEQFGYVFPGAYEAYEAAHKNA